MATEIHIVSGFLGAGKTTFIQKLLDEAFQDQKTVLIENDFGAVNIDAALLRAGGITVREINAGCICCSLAGDFIASLREVAERFHPDIIVIEPSGVSKLSDIVKSCRDSGVGRIASQTAIVDVKRCRTYLENFGEFFEDQIRHAGVIVLSRCTDHPDKIPGAKEIIAQINADAPIFAENWSELNAARCIGGGKEQAADACGCGHHHHHHHHGAKDIFDTVTIRTDHRFSTEELAAVLRKMKSWPAVILRAKGIVQGLDGQLEMQYLPEEIKIRPTNGRGNSICVIGQNLDEKELTRLFHGEFGA